MKIRILVISIVLLLLVLGGYSWYQNQKSQKFACETDSDCIMSYSDPEDFQICVNSVYYEKQENKTQIYQCIIDKSLSCSCQKNVCVRSDRKKGCK
ncbi:hypothetical protein CSB09_00175 [Candidatus Gracilibacteria bacterium]|nr:MAG: hypothetical protein CSB09_00175 [Candidatus Gracilibacteria bacterium]